jgi:hypothetical protein
MMRTLFATVISAALTCATPVCAQWKEYVYPELGLAKEFPAPPTETAGTYQTPGTGRAVTARVFSVDMDGILYRMIAADLSAAEFLPRSASLYAECIARAEQEGTVRAHMPQRVEDGVEWRVYGQLTSVDLSANAGRKQTNCFFSKGHLLIIEAWVRPEHGEINAASAVRFSTGVRFRLDPPTP